MRAGASARRWVADPTALLMLLIPLAAWTASRAVSTGEVLPALALAGVVGFAATVVGAWWPVLGGPVLALVVGVALREGLGRRPAAVGCSTWVRSRDAERSVRECAALRSASRLRREISPRTRP